MAELKNGASEDADLGGLTHRFLHGLRFDGLWQYPVQLASGHLSWRELPLEPVSRRQAPMGDPEGIWSCVRRCVAALRRATWKSVHLPHHLPPRPDSEGVAQVLLSMLPGWAVQQPQDEPASMVSVCHALERGGCALLRMRLLSAYQPAVCWAWVVGAEMQKHVCALLVVGPQLAPCWVCGYGARVTVGARGVCHVRCTDGRHLRCDGMEVLILAPEPPP